MANLLNNCTFMGRLTRDPEVSSIPTSNGELTKVRFSLAVDRAVRKGQQKETDFINFSAIGPKAEFISKYFTKGKPMFVNATFRTYKVEKNGQTTYGYDFDVQDVQFVLQDSSQNAGANQSYQAPAQQQSTPKPQSAKPDFDASAFGGDFLVDANEFPFF